MTRDEYVHYSDCRQASFTYRKAKRFREFINFQAHLDIRPNDEIVDILGFLAFEMVRSLCVTALSVRKRMTTSRETTDSSYPISLFAPPPSARQPLLPAHVLEAFAQIQREQAGSRGLRNFRSGMSRGRMALV
jgi:transcription initiation protein SPT3